MRALQLCRLRGLCSCQSHQSAGWSTARNFIAGRSPARQFTEAAEASARSAWRRYASGSACVAGALVGALVYFDTSAKTLGLKRNLKFWVRAFPMYLHYRVTEELVRGKPDDQADAAYNALHDRYAQPTVELCIEMGGYFFKSAQIVSTRDEFVPHQYMAWLKGLQDQAPPQRSAAEVRALISESLNAPIESIFSRFDDEAIGAASVGQVHRAQLTTGEECAVKVMYPNVEALFRADMRIITNFCWLAMPHHLPALREIEKQFLSEFDYVREADNMQRVAAALNSNPHFRTRVFVPSPYRKLCTREVLVMEFVPGAKLVDALRAAMEPFARRRGTSVAALEEEERERIKREGLSSAGAATLRYRLAQLWIFSCAIAHNAGALIVNAFVSYVAGRRALVELRSLVPPPNLGMLLQVLLDVHGYEIFQLGCFNGDPHPGNIMLMPDGRLGLIDYGSCVTLGEDHRRLLARLMLSLEAQHPSSRDEVVKLYSEEMGVKTRKMKPDILYR